jgi:hypothetical protein
VQADAGVAAERQIAGEPFGRVPGPDASRVEPRQVSRTSLGDPVPDRHRVRRPTSHRVRAARRLAEICLNLTSMSQKRPLRTLSPMKGRFLAHGVVRKGVVLDPVLSEGMIFAGPFGPSRSLHRRTSEPPAPAQTT